MYLHANKVRHVIMQSETICGVDRSLVLAVRPYAICVRLSVTEVIMFSELSNSKLYVDLPLSFINLPRRSNNAMNRRVKASPNDMVACF